MITRIRLENFQGHEKLDLKLGAVTTIVGASDRGKSSVTRALRWAVTNKPGGQEFIRHGTKQARVRIELDGDVIVSRTRSKSENAYTLRTAEAKAEFKAFGTGVPDEVATALNLGELNFQQQHDAPFWFTLSAPDVARKLNDVVDLSLIDDVLEHLAGRMRGTRAEEKAATTRAEAAATELAGLEWVAEAQAELAAIATAREGRAVAEAERVALGQAVSTVRDVVVPPTVVIPEKLAKVEAQLVKLFSEVESLGEAMHWVDEREKLLAEARADRDIIVKQYKTESAKRKDCPECGQPLP